MTKEKIYELYITQNLGSKKISEILNISPTTVIKLVKKYGFEVKEKKRPVKYHANHDFFATWSNDMAYCLGFIAADGHVWKERPFLNIAVHKQDIKVLEYIVKNISPTTKIRENKNMVQVCIHSQKIWEDLKRYGISHGKTFNFQIDFDIPEEFWSDYLRGFFDGDGSIHRKTYKDKINYLVFKSSIVGACLQPLEYFKNRLGFGNIRLIRNKYYELGFNQQETIKLGNLIYKDKDSFRMERKYEKFKLINPRIKTKLRFCC